MNMGGYPFTVGTALMILLAGFGIQATAVSPLDNDAGSGGDAPDAAGLALAIAPGTHVGTLLPPGDRLDYYAFQAEAGQFIRLSQFSDNGVNVRVYHPGEEQVCGEPCATISDEASSGETVFLPVTQTGTWIVVIYPRVENRVAATPYTFTVEVGESAANLLLDSTDAWNTVEIRADTPGRRTGYLDIQTPDLMSKPAFSVNTDTFSAMLLVEFDYDSDHEDAWFMALIQGQGTGYEVTTAALPGVEVPVRFQQGRGNHQPAWFYLNEPATLRVTTLHTGFAPMVTLAFVADSPTEIRHAAGGETVTVNDRSLDATLLAPGVTIAPERSFSLDMETRFTGVFKTPTGAGGTTGTVRRPDGTVFPQYPGCLCVLFQDPEPGTWSFRVGSQTRAVTAQHDYLVGAFIPRLGLY